jgi:hypothetical protein
MKKYLTNGLIIVSFILILVITIPGAYFGLPAKTHYHIVEKHKVSGLDDHARVNIGIVLPKSGAYQEIKNILVQWEGEQELESNLYTDTYRLWMETAEKNEGEAVIEYDVILPQSSVYWEAPVEEGKLLPQEGIESDHPAIIQKAIEYSNNPREIYQFTSQHLIYSEENCADTNTSALEAYRLASGSCAGYARLMVALCRAAGIPAQMIFGTVLPDDYIPRTQPAVTGIPGAGHAWVEYYFQGDWSLADPSWGKGYTSLLEFNRNDGRHLSYGEYDHFNEVSDHLTDWASTHSFILDQKLAYIISASTDTASATSEIKVAKQWDGRWLNTIAIFAVVTYSLCKIRDKFILKKSVR